MPVIAYTLDHAMIIITGAELAEILQPMRLLESGFTFKYPKLQRTLEDILGTL